MTKASICFILFFAFTVLVFAQARVDAAGGPRVLNAFHNLASVGLYAKLQARLMIQAHCVNRFDPHEIDIMVTFTSPSGKKWNIPGFYQYTFGTMSKVGFSPDELGVWNYQVKVRDKSGTGLSEEK